MIKNLFSWRKKKICYLKKQNKQKKEFVMAFFFFKMSAFSNKMVVLRWQYMYAIIDK